MNGKALASMAVVAILLVTAVCIVPPSDATGDTDVLLDHGNGSVEWTQSSGGTVEDVLADAMIGLGVDFEISSGTISVDGVSSKTVGSSSNGGSLEESGATGATVTTEWHVFLWDGSSWVETDELSAPADASAVALAFYPDGIAPVVTPDHPYAVTMSRGDSSNTGNFDADYSSGEEYEVTWSETGTAHANILYAGGYVFQKYGIDSTGTARVVCIDGETGEHVWDFEFTSGSNYESSTPLIVGDWIYVATMTGYIYRIPLYEGPGENNANVTSIGDVPFSEASPVEAVLKDFEVGNTYDSGFSSMVFDSGVIYVTHSNGMVYCFDTDLNLIWSQMLDGSTYLVAPTVYDGYLFTGALDGRLYVLDAVGGGIVADTTVAQYRYQSKVYGGVGQVAVQPTGNGTYTLYMTFSDGLGMSQINCGFAIYEFSPSGNVLVERYRNEDLGDMGRYILPVDTPDFRGVYFVAAPDSGTNLYRIDSVGNLETMTEGLAEIHSAPVLADDRYIYLVSYSSSDPIYQISLDGTIVGTASCPSGVRNFNMIPLVVLGDTIFGGTDSGIYRFDGAFPVYVAPSLEQGQPLILIIAEIVAAILVALGLVYAVLRFKGHEKPFNYLKTSFLHYLYGDDQSHNTRNKHRLKFIIVIGAILTFAAFTLCLCVGSTSIENPVEAYSALFSAISKGGVGLDSLETTIYVSRLPRTIAALAVGIGLSVAGCIYQAIIRNPLVDPYIMGVSSGAGVAAIAVIAFDFTFFGMFSSHSIFLTAITACIGGLIAFACTMLLAEKSGGSAINYVLSGVVIGLAFSAVQTIMLTMAGNKLSNALSWLYGSFAEVTWSQVGIIVFLAVFLSLVPLIWAKELNLVLLGEDQARQMGLNVRRFNRWMLILASILTSVCVAFCGVIGFVGLVIPHLCRMLLGSDHRMVLPASICFGGVMLMLADLLARTGYYGMELPVGAITTVIGIPVFAYLLIKRGRMYDG